MSSSAPPPGAVSGACIVSKVSGMAYIREDLTPSVLEWRAVDLSKNIAIELNSLSKLQATPETSPKMILKVIYKADDAERDIRMSFSNRPTMNHIKDALQTIVSRHRTTINSEESASPAGTPGPTSAPGAAANALDFSVPESLADASLLKNHQLQQKLLMDDKNLRNVFTQAVINFKLSPTVFWSTRLSQLRTYALTISQHRGPYNVLSTIKPVATSDNQVNVNVTRNTIKEIFDTYPVVQKAYADLVPVKFGEGEFWSRFFTSKLFRRLRGDKINNATDRGDALLDKYMYIDGDLGRDPRKDEVSKFIDVEGNEDDNSQRLGNQPDFTMKFSESTANENEMVILMKNMNKLSSKMITSSSDRKIDNPTKLSNAELDEFRSELDLHDLNDQDDVNFVDLVINSNINDGAGEVAAEVPAPELKRYLQQNVVPPSVEGVNLIDTYRSTEAIESINAGIMTLVKQNYRNFKLINKEAKEVVDNIVDNTLSQEIVTLNITTTEFLSHFWKLFLNGNNPAQLKKIFTSLKSCRTTLLELKAKIKAKMFSDSRVDNDKLKEKLENDLNFHLSAISNPLDKALSEYVKAVRSADVNENGKRPLEAST